VKSPSKKPSLGEVVAKPSEGLSEESDGAYSAAVEELAEILGVADVEAFRSAFEAAVMSCK
jgi:hypothetical protein